MLPCYLLSYTRQGITSTLFNTLLAFKTETCFFPEILVIFLRMKSKFVLLVLIAGFLAIFACTNPIMELARPKKAETPALNTQRKLIEMVWINPGTFLMGSPANEPGHDIDETQHQVTLTKGFYMGKVPVTQAQYQAVMGSNPSEHKVGGVRAFYISGIIDTTNFPVEMVSWYDAIVFCNKLSMQEFLSPAYRINGSTDPAAWGTVPTGSNSTWNAVEIVSGSTGYRLPTEAQWEYACRAGTTTAYNTGATISDNTGWYRGSSEIRSHKVGLKPPNAWGLYDMHGDVYELCWDTSPSPSSDYTSGPQTDPIGPASGSYKIMRGGSWNESSQDHLRSAYRDRINVSDQLNDTGFRVVRP
jgi:formylglycine-generating enzyme required for sulfatase activity